LDKRDLTDWSATDLGERVEKDENDAWIPVTSRDFGLGTVRPRTIRPFIVKNYYV